jgi:hypothetical protein
MRNKLKLLLTISLMLFFPITVNALSGTLSMSCSPSEAKAGDIITCSLSGTTDTDIYGVTGTFDLPDGIEINSQNITFADDNWEGKTINGNKIAPYMGNPANGSFQIGSIKFKLSDSISEGSKTIKLTDVKFYDLDDNYSVSDATVSVTVGSGSEPVETEKGLKNLSITNGTLGRPFSSLDNDTGYAVLLDSETTTTFGISATSKNANDTIVIKNGHTDATLNASSIEFNPPSGQTNMQVKIYVGEGDNQVIYTLNVARPVPQEVEGGELATLTVGGKNVTLSSSKYEYEVTLDDVSSYTVDATLKDSENYEFSSFFVPPKVLSGEGQVLITINHKENLVEQVSYTITIKKAGSSATPSQKPPVNPSTGGTSAFIMAIVLIASLGVAMYYYKKNMQSFE